MRDLHAKIGEPTVERDFLCAGEHPNGAAP